MRISDWIQTCALPISGPVNTLDQVFADPQVLAREMKVSMPYRGSRDGKVDLIGNPIKFSETPEEYRFAPPRAGQDSDAVHEELPDIGHEERARLLGQGSIPELFVIKRRQGAARVRQSKKV